MPGLGRIRVDRLTVADVRQYLYGLPLHPQTVSHHRAVLRKALADAVTEGLLTRNVASLAKPPTVPRTERRWLSGDELRALFDATAGTRLHALWVLAGTTGTPLVLNSSDSAWGDVDLDGGVLRVRHTLHRDGGEWVFRPTKTEPPAASPSPTTPSGHSDSTERDNLRMRLQRERARLVASSSRPSEDSHSTAPTSPSTSGPTSPTRDYPW